MLRLVDPVAERAPRQREVVADAWTSEIVPTLPADLAQQAEALGAFQRTRAIPSAAALLRGLLAYILCAPSFRQLGAWGVLADVADVSDTAWRKRLRRASAWLLWLLGELLPAAPLAPTLTQRFRGRIWLWDATVLAQLGGRGNDWRLHLGYDLLAGRMGQVAITDRHGAESFDYATFQGGDIVVADAGYGYRRMLATVFQQHADVVMRITPATFPLETSLGRPLDLVAWLRRGGSSLRSSSGYAVWEQQRIRVRVIAIRLSETQQRAAAYRVRRNAAQHNRIVSETTLFLSGWMLLATSLDATSWSDSEIVALYRARWQVELLFKRMKQLLRLHVVRAHSAETAEATVRAALVAWALQERESAELYRIIRSITPLVADVVQWRWDGDDVVSRWAVSAVLVETLRQQVRGSWALAKVRGSLLRLRRYMLSHPRPRGHQETDVWNWLRGVEFVTARPQQKAA